MPRGREPGWAYAVPLNEFGYSFGGPVFIPKKFNVDRSKLFLLVDSVDQMAPVLDQHGHRTLARDASRRFQRIAKSTNIYFGKTRVITNL